jgi:hypothetical protein
MPLMGSNSACKGKLNLKYRFAQTIEGLGIKALRQVFVDNNAFVEIIVY